MMHRSLHVRGEVNIPVTGGGCSWGGRQWKEEDPKGYNEDSK